MCGIVGLFQRQGAADPLSPADILRLRHRGPDGEGLFTEGPISLGHTRLSIIDLSDRARQPLCSLDKRFVITYNGEVYNYLDLRAELVSRGARFFSDSDTEVVVEAYREWGADCVRRFRGMFAFALWDRQAKNLFMARDRCGERPFFYYRDGERFIFASELKGLIPLLPSTPALDPASVDMYLHYQYVPEPWTLLRGVHKLQAAHTLTLSTDHWDAQPERYWNVEDAPDLARSPELTELPTDMSGIQSRIREALESAVVHTLRSDVPVGVALSGGIDSGVIATFAQKHYPEPMHAFSVGYPGRPHYDERDQARALAQQLGMIFHEVELPMDSFVDFFPEFVRIMDEPIADPAAFGHYSVPKAASDLGIKVLLTGIGGDELFWGYDWTSRAAHVNRSMTRRSLPSGLRCLLQSSSVSKIIARWEPRLPEGLRNWVAGTRGSGLVPPKDQLAYMQTVPDFNDAARLVPPLYGPGMEGLAKENAFAPTAIGVRRGDQIPAAVIRLLFDTWLVSNCLSLGDRVSMSVGVEARLPFLDHRLIELTMALRRRIPDHALGQKAWLRAALKGILPDEVLARPKAGFQPPVREWLEGVVGEYGAILSDGALVRTGILARMKVDQVLTELPQQGWSGLFIAYKLTLLEMWLREVVSGN